MVSPLGLTILAVKLGTPIAQLAATQAVARGRLTEPGNQAGIYNFCHVFSLANM